MLDPNFLFPALAAAGSAGAAWGAVKVALNGTRTRVRQIQDGLHHHMQEEHKDYSDQADRLARLETKIDLLLSGQLNLHRHQHNDTHHHHEQSD